MEWSVSHPASYAAANGSDAIINMVTCGQTFSTVVAIMLLSTWN